MFATELTLVIATLAGLLVIGLRLVATLGLLECRESCRSPNIRAEFGDSPY